MIAASEYRGIVRKGYLSAPFPPTEVVRAGTTGRRPWTGVLDGYRLASGDVASGYLASTAAGSESSTNSDGDPVIGTVRSTPWTALARSRNHVVSRQKGPWVANHRTP